MERSIAAAAATCNDPRVERDDSGRPKGTVTFLFTDIERSTELTRKLGAGFGDVRSRHRHALRESFARHGGHEIDTAGDGFFVVFERAGEAVAAAIDAQRAVENGADDVRVRIGIHSAEPFVHEDGYVGVGVSRAARICAAGHGGQILLSNATAGIVEDLDLGGVELLDLGEHALKDIARPQRLFQLVVEGLPSGFPPLNALGGGGRHGSVVTLLFSDVRGWQEVMRTYGDERAIEAARAYQAIVREVAEDEGGRIAELAGDRVLCAFDRAHGALSSARRIRDRLRSEAWFLTDDPPPVSVAIHSGYQADPTGLQLGSTALRCDRLCRLADPGQILVSQATQALLVGTLADGGLRDLGERALLDDEPPVRVFAVSD